jgi:hypothetical protein
MRVFDNSDPQHIAVKDFIFDCTVEVDGVVFTIPSRTASETLSAIFFI